VIERGTKLLTQANKRIAIVIKPKINELIESNSHPIPKTCLDLVPRRCEAWCLSSFVSGAIGVLLCQEAAYFQNFLLCWELAMSYCAERQCIVETM